MEQRDMNKYPNEFSETKHRITRYMLNEGGLGITKLKAGGLPWQKIHDQWTFWSNINIRSILVESNETN